METLAAGISTARRESVYFLNKLSSVSPPQLSDTPLSACSSQKKAHEMLG